MVDLSHLNDDERRLAELGYKQELKRNWSGFSNFAISFSIISILAGCFTTFGQAWNNGGPLAISWGWPIISALILVIGLCMSELVSAFPTSGGIYWWASTLGDARAGYYTGWLNLIGLVGMVASVAYGCATFLDATLGTYSASWAAGYSLGRVFVIFIGVLAVASLLNIFRGHLMAVLNNISVWWHVLGTAAVIGILVLLPSRHQSVGWVFTHQINNSGYGNGKYWFLVLPLGFLLTQYTIIGFDASAHLSEETRGAAHQAARGIWQAILYSAIGGWLLLLAFLFAVQDEAGVTKAGGAVSSIFTQALSSGWAATVLLIASVGQFFCTTACITSSSRMLFAFSRDGAVPGAALWSKLSSNRVPANAVVFSSVISALITLPALKEVDINGAPVPVAFYVVNSVAVIGLFVAFGIPIWLRWRAGDSFRPGPWTLGNKYKWMNLVAVIEIAIVSVYFILPFTPAAIPFTEGFSWKFVNYAPVLTVGSLVVLWIGWHVSAKKWFTGPKHTIDLPSGVSSSQEISLEHHRQGYLTGEHGS
jgi:amino acid transporter